MADGGENDVCGVALAAVEIAAAEVAIDLHVSDHGFDCRTTPQFALDDAEDAALLTGDEDATRIGRVVRASLKSAADGRAEGGIKTAEASAVARSRRPGRHEWRRAGGTFYLMECAPMNRKARDRRIAQEIADELTKALDDETLAEIVKSYAGGPVAPEMLIEEHRDTFEQIFTRVFDAHGIFTGWAGANVLKCVPRILAKSMLQRKVR